MCFSGFSFTFNSCNTLLPNLDRLASAYLLEDPCVVLSNFWIIVKGLSALNSLV
jgi:hypothetical protein